MNIAFTVYGKPSPKLRPRAVTRVRLKDGNYKMLDRPVFYDKTDKTWTEAIRQEALRHRPETPLQGPLFLSLRFIMEKPSSKPRYKRWHDVRPDLDNLCKTVKDVLRKVIYRDDGQIAGLYAKKQYGNVPRLEVAIVTLFEEKKRHANRSHQDPGSYNLFQAEKDRSGATITVA